MILDSEQQSVVAMYRWWWWWWASKANIHLQLGATMARVLCFVAIAMVLQGAQATRFNLQVFNQSVCHDRFESILYTFTAPHPITLTQSESGFLFARIVWHWFDCSNAAPANLFQVNNKSDNNYQIQLNLKSSALTTPQTFHLIIEYNLTAQEGESDQVHVELDGVLEECSKSNCCTILVSVLISVCILLLSLCALTFIIIKQRPDFFSFLGKLGSRSKESASPDERYFHVLNWHELWLSFFF